MPILIPEVFLFMLISEWWIILFIWLEPTERKDAFERTKWYAPKQGRGKQEVKEGRGLHPGRLVFWSDSVGSVVMPQVISFQGAPHKDSFVELLTEEDLEFSILFISKCSVDSGQEIRIFYSMICIFLAVRCWCSSFISFSLSLHIYRRRQFVSHRALLWLQSGGIFLKEFRRDRAVQKSAWHWTDSQRTRRAITMLTKNSK